MLRILEKENLEEGRICLTSDLSIEELGELQQPDNEILFEGKYQGMAAGGEYMVVCKIGDVWDSVASPFKFVYYGAEDEEEIPEFDTAEDKPAETDTEAEDDSLTFIQMFGQWCGNFFHKTVRFNSDNFVSKVKTLFERGETIETLCSKKRAAGYADSWAYIDSLLLSEPIEKHEPAPVPDVEKPEKSETEDEGLKLLRQALAGNIVADIKADVQDKFERFIKENFGTLPTKTIILKDDKVVTEDVGVRHYMFEKVLKLVDMKLPVYLEGEAGTGKNELAKQIADAMGLEFWFSNSVTNEYQIKGFTDAGGKYNESQFYHAFTGGGLFFMDELDASIPDTLVMLNSAISNGYFDFPAPIGRVMAHPDFRVIAAGNTSGQGANALYTGRCALDGASLDRFIDIIIDYDPKIEELCCEGDDELLEFARDLRDTFKRQNVIGTVSYRGIKNCHMSESILGTAEAAVSAFFKSRNKDDVRMILSEMGCRNRFTKELKKWLEQ